MSKRHHTQIARDRNLRITEECYKRIKEAGGTHQDLIRTIIHNTGCTWGRAEIYLRDLGLESEE